MTDEKKDTDEQALKGTGIALLPKKPATGLIKMLNPKAAVELYTKGIVTLPGGIAMTQAPSLMTDAKAPSMAASVSVDQKIQFPYKGSVYEAIITANPTHGFSCTVTKDVNGTPQPSGSGLDKMILGAVIVQYALTQGYDPAFGGVLAPAQEAPSGDGQGDGYDTPPDEGI